MKLAKEYTMRLFISLLNGMTWLIIVCFACYNLAVVYSPFFDDVSPSKLLLHDFFLIAVTISFVISARMLEAFALNDRQRKQELMLAHHLKRTLLSVMSHDVRGPLSSIKGILNCCSQGVITYDELKENSSKLKDSVDSVLVLLDTLMLWSMGQNDSFAMERKDVNLSQVVDDVFKPYAPFSERKHVQLKNEINPEMIVLADTMMLTLIIRNLLVNTLKFTSGCSIIIRAKQSHQLTEVSIQNTGEGVGKKIFEKFFRGSFYLTDSEVNCENSVEFALMLCEEFVRRHGGSLSYVSQKGAGTTLCFTISRQSDNESVAYTARRTESENRVLNRIKSDTGLNFESSRRSNAGESMIEKGMLLHALW